jgi:predicted Zn-dependent protease
MVRIFIPSATGGRGHILDTARMGAAGARTAVTPKAVTPKAADAESFEKALSLCAMGMRQEALHRVQAFTEQAPGHAAAWRLLADLLALAGRDGEAKAAMARAAQAPADQSAWAVRTDPRGPAQFVQAEARLREHLSEIPAEHHRGRLREIISGSPRAAAAMRLLAQLELRQGEEDTACALLQRAIDLAPLYIACRADLLLLQAHRSAHAFVLAETARLLRDDPRNVLYRVLRADALRAVGDLPAAIALMDDLIREGQRAPNFQCVYAQALHFAGRSQEAADIYRACLAAAPDTETAYWGLAEMRGDYLAESDIAPMRALAARADIEPARRMMLCYALGQALERVGAYGESFAAYSQGARLCQQQAASAGTCYDPDTLERTLDRHRAVFTAAALSRHAAAPGAPGPTPIFIVGMPRAGSTLVEQILASHSLVEATLELPVLPAIARHLAHSRALISPDAYPECLTDMNPDQLAALGASYIGQSALYRRTTKPFFIDKLPANWQHVGLIRLILPHAKIIDVRRSPMAACFAMFKQILPDAAFSYSLPDVADYYSTYATMMQYWNDTLPGHVHALAYETLVDQPEAEIRALLSFCGLPFEAACLRFWETPRPVATPSATQVRRPIFRDAVDQWRNFEPWLTELQLSLS